MATLLKRPDLCDPLVTRFMRLHFTKITIKPTCWAPLPFFFILGTVCHNILHSLVKNQYKLETVLSFLLDFHPFYSMTNPLECLCGS